jgi:hypothetical protein
VLRTQLPLFNREGLFVHKMSFGVAVMLALFVLPVLSCSDSSTDPGNDSNGGQPAFCERTPLPPPSGNVISASSTQELITAVATANSSGGNITVLIADGTYTLDQALFVGGDNITIRSSSGQRNSVVIRGQGMAGSVTRIFMVSGDGFVAVDMTIGYVSENAIEFLQNSDNHVVHNVHFVDTGAQMLKVTLAAPDTARSDNGLVEWCMFEYQAGVGPQDYIGGIFAHRARNWTVRHNVFKHIRSPGGPPAGFAVHFWSESSGTLVEYNTITNCDRGIGFGMGSSGHQGGLIRNNMVHTTRDVGISLETSTSTFVYNNSLFTENYSNSIEYRFLGTQFASIINNLTNASIASREGGTGVVETNVTSATSDLFTDAANGDLHLAKADTTVVDKGQSLAQVTRDIDCESRPKGSAYDIGADEY